MHEEILKRPAIVKFDKMIGRNDGDDTEKIAVDDEIGPVEGSLDLEIRDWHPNKPSIAPGYVMPDPKKQPRFPKAVAPEYVEDPNAPLPNYEIRMNKEPVLVNMGKMTGRHDDDIGIDSESIDSQGKAGAVIKFINMYLNSMGFDCYHQ